MFAVLLRRINNPNFAIHPQRLSVKFLVCHSLPAIDTVLKFKLFVFDKNTIHILHETAEVHMSRCFDLAVSRLSLREIKIRNLPTFVDANKLRSAVVKSGA